VITEEVARPIRREKLLPTIVSSIGALRASKRRAPSVAALRVTLTPRVALVRFCAHEESASGATQSS
jgi:hypothetical protein